MTAIGKADALRLLGQFNLNHLLYFWAVGRAGSVTAAAERLGVSQPSVSEQVRTLEARLGARLLDRGPRGVTLTEAGQAAMRYAEEVVGVCSDLVQSIPLEGRHTERPLIAGTADAVPKIVVRDILAPLLTRDPPIPVVCREWRLDHLLAELSLHRLDLVISDTALPTAEGSPLRCLVVGSSPVALYAAPKLARRCRGRPAAWLREVPLLLLAPGAPLRTALDGWLAEQRVRPRVAAEVEDRALLHHFAEAGLGVVPVSLATAPDVVRQFGLVKVGMARGVLEQYHLVIVEREHAHPGVELVRAGLARRGATVAAFQLPGARAGPRSPRALRRNHRRDT